MRQYRIILIYLSAFALTSCQSAVDEYARVTSQAITDLDTKVSNYAADSGRIDAARAEAQARNQQRLDADALLIQQQVGIWNVAKDTERARLMTALQSTSNQALAAQNSSAPTPVSIKAIEVPSGLSAAAKALDGLAQATSVSDRFKMLVKYGQAVQQDVENDKKAKSAEASGPKVTPSGGN